MVSERASFIPTRLIPAAPMVAGLPYLNEAALPEKPTFREPTSFSCVIAPEEEFPLEQPELNQVLDQKGKIARKFGGTTLRLLRKIYGPGFAPSFPDNVVLSRVLKRLDTRSLSQLHHHRSDMTVEERMRKA
jgi:hypothetical protein